MSYSGEPALIQYRVSGADAWHPAGIKVRPFGFVNWYSLAAPLCWVDGNACNEAGCFSQANCSDSIAPSQTYDFDECALGTAQCSINALCKNMYAGYSCFCRAGYYGTGTGQAGSGTNCIQCPAGRYTVTEGQKSCQLCPARTTGPAGSNSSQNCFCAPGYYGTIVTIESRCEPCPEASYCSGGAVRTACPYGAWSPSNSESVSDCVCVPGFYGTNGQNCTVCPAGSACEGGWQQPKMCPNNTYAKQGMSACDACLKNSTSGVGAAKCTCDLGLVDSSYFEFFSSGTCRSNGCRDVSSLESVGGQLCKKAWIQFGSNYSYSAAETGAGCKLSGSTISAGGAGSCTNASECVCQDCSPATCDICPAGKFLDSSGVFCDKCPPNSWSTVGAVAVTQCKCDAGYFGTVVTNQSVCGQCSAGTYSKTPGQATCSQCEPGSYQGDPRQSSCTACPTLATSLLGSTLISQCFCGNGTSGPSGGVCTDVDECNTTTMPSPCAASTLATCTNTVGSFTCKCNPGNYGDGVTCAVCQAGFECPNGTQTFQCPGGTWSAASALSCTACPGNSTSKAGSTKVAECSCNPGYAFPNGTTTSCINVDECAGGACVPPFRCEDTEGSFSCSCGDGGVYPFCQSACGDGLVSGGEQCDDGNLVAGDGCNRMCEEEPGYNCTGNNPSVCGDKDECLAGPCANNATCNNTHLSYTCSCDAGFYGTGFGCFMCPAQSTSAAGAVLLTQCRCGAGYLLNEQATCVDAQECLAPGANDCHANATCANTVGSYVCSCKSGYMNSANLSRANGTDCVDKNECAAGAGSDCDVNAHCTNTYGSFSCSCIPGYYDVSASLSKRVGTAGTCTSCARGTYSGAGGATSCLACPSNSSTLTPGATAVTSCVCDAGLSGTILNRSSNCSVCGEGYYSLAGATSCTACGGGATSPRASKSVAACACPAGTYLSGAQCMPCTPPPSVGGDSPMGSTAKSQCICGAGYYKNLTLNGNASASLYCSVCNSCPVGYKMAGCGGTAEGECIDVDECAGGTSSCDRQHANCTNSVGSFQCACHGSFYGADGTLCSACPPNSASPNGSTTMMACSCKTGFTTGDGSTVVVEDALEMCVTSLEVEVATSGQSMPCLAGYNASAEYCGASAGTTGDVWLRVGWSDDSWTEWYSFPSIRRVANGAEAYEGVYNLSAGSAYTVFLPSVDRVGGAPSRIEYFISSRDAWNPASFGVKLMQGVVPGGGGADAAGWFRTRGTLCWVDGDGQSVSQASLGCAFVGSSARASLLGAAPGGTSDKSVGMLRIPGAGSMHTPQDARSYETLL